MSELLPLVKIIFFFAIARFSEVNKQRSENKGKKTSKKNFSSSCVTTITTNFYLIAEIKEKQLRTNGCKDGKEFNDFLLIKLF